MREIQEIEGLGEERVLNELNCFYIEGILLISKESFRNRKNILYRSLTFMIVDIPNPYRPLSPKTCVFKDKCKAYKLVVIEKKVNFLKNTFEIPILILTVLFNLIIQKSYFDFCFETVFLFFYFKWCF